MAHSIYSQGEGTKGTLELLFQVKALGLPAPVTELEFHPVRHWRFDFAWPNHNLALEIEGGIFRRKGAVKCRYCGQTPSGRHSTGKGMIADMEKYNAATLLGWRLIRVTPQMVSSGEALTLIEKALK